MEAPRLRPERSEEVVGAVFFLSLLLAGDPQAQPDDHKEVYAEDDVVQRRERNGRVHFHQWRAQLSMRMSSGSGTEFVPNDQLGLTKAFKEDSAQ